jgi:two-component system, NtrC family, sensor kinase
MKPLPVRRFNPYHASSWAEGKTMKRRSRASGKSGKTVRRKATTPKRGNARKTIGRRGSPSGTESEVARLSRELNEALEREAATAEILASITGSTADTRPVFEAILSNLSRLFGTRYALILLVRDGMLHFAGSKGPPGIEKFAERYPLPIDDKLHAGKAILAGRPLQIVPVIGNPAAPPITQKLAAEFGYNALFSVPMIHEGKAIGVLNTAHRDPIAFTDKQIALIKSFADQAVIAIENARLLNELRQRTGDLAESLEQQTATSEVLGVISRSKFELQPILQSVVNTAARLCRAEAAVIFRLEDGLYRFAAGYSLDPAYVEIEQHTPISPGPGTIVGRAAMSRRVARIDDAWTDPLYEKRQDAEIGSVRSMIGVPLMREGEPIGVIGLARSRVEPFTDREIELVTIFADQAVIAIENVRLFESVEARTRELSASLDQLRTAQDRLVQTEKLASLGQLTAGIAHEIKNPLNFVNNFSSMSVELIDELRTTLSDIHLDDKRRTEINDITDMLQGNLDRVVQHGKRADSIVKNMLLHSRAGSGEHRPVDVNALVEESLNLAYHGARAETQGFTITLERSFDPAAGEVDLFPQEITRVLLNLISNGFYAATRRRAEEKDGDYEPTLTAATKNLGDSVEIRFRDNGTGISTEVKEKMFNPFFTTKPAGEGTGLGLSISHDIIVKQHGGSIEVDTEPGEFTEFRIVLPRGAPTVAKSAARSGENA